jgi:pantoate--beta-alanine ligase
MKIIKTISEWRFEQNTLRGKTVGFVPTMGALHQGHLSLITTAKNENDLVIASIFVNPMQFNSLNDFTNYPSTLERDIALLQQCKCDYLFLPDQETIYPKNDHFKLSESEITKFLCGPTRPGHFDGVATVVLKLFNIIQPTTSYFGEKDYQQLRLIKAMTESLFLPIKISAQPTVRDKYGLALSSRNQRLSAAGISQARLVVSIFLNVTDLAIATDRIRGLEVKIDYLEEIWGRRFIAFFVEGVRLIDNVDLGAIGVSKFGALKMAPLVLEDARP